MRTGWLLLVLAACKDGALDDTAGGDDTGTGSGALSLDSCTTSVGEGVPDFYADLFLCTTLTLEGDVVVLESTGLPPHLSYYYGEGHPNYTDFDTSRGADYRPNPNQLDEQSHRLEIPLEPVSRGLTITDEMVDNVAGTSEFEYRTDVAGLSLDGVAMFDGKAAPGDDIAEERYTFDSYEGHPQNTGVYHYHSATPGPLEVLVRKGYITSSTPGAGKLEVFAVMCDGTVMLGCSETDGSDPGAALDGQGGHVHDIADPEGGTWLADRYHIHACGEEVPYSPELAYYEGCEAAGPP